MTEQRRPPDESRPPWLFRAAPPADEPQRDAADEPAPDEGRDEWDLDLGQVQDLVPPEPPAPSGPGPSRSEATEVGAPDDPTPPAPGVPAAERDEQGEVADLVPSEVAPREEGAPPPQRPQVTAPFDDVRAAVRRLRTTVLRFEVRMSALEQEVRGLTRSLREAVASIQGVRGAETDPDRLAQAMDLLARRVAAELATTREAISADLAGRVRDEVRQAIASALAARPPSAPPPSEEEAPAAAPRPDVEELRARIWGEGNPPR